MAEVPPKWSRKQFLYQTVIGSNQRDPISWSKIIKNCGQGAAVYEIYQDVSDIEERVAAAIVWCCRIRGKLSDKHSTFGTLWSDLNDYTWTFNTLPEADQDTLRAIQLGPKKYFTHIDGDICTEFANPDVKWHIDLTAIWK